VQERDRNEVIEWLEAQILTEAAKEVKGMTARLHSAKVQEGYSASPGIAMKRFIDLMVPPRAESKGRYSYEGFQRGTGTAT
jgi:hypothetical protein